MSIHRFSSANERSHALSAIATHHSCIGCSPSTVTSTQGIQEYSQETGVCLPARKECAIIKAEVAITRNVSRALGAPPSSRYSNSRALVIGGLDTELAMGINLIWNKSSPSRNFFKDLVVAQPHELM